MNTTLRILIACFVGAFIGGLVALELHPAVWWLGALLGGGVAYVGFNVEEVIAAVPVAFRRATSWRPNSEYWALWRFVFAQNYKAYSIMTCALMIPVGLMMGFDIVAVVTSPESLFWVLLFCFGAPLIPAMCDDGAGMWFARGVHRAEDVPEWIEAPNAFRFYFWILPRTILRGSLWVAVRIPDATRTFIGATRSLLVTVGVGIWRFGIELFHLVHSELRLLCFIDAAIGAGVGYLTGNALLGAVVGGLWGVLNYEIITIRVLKLAGAKSLFR